MNPTAKPGKIKKALQAITFTGVLAKVIKVPAGEEDNNLSGKHVVILPWSPFGDVGDSGFQLTLDVEHPVANREIPLKESVYALDDEHVAIQGYVQVKMVMDARNSFTSCSLPLATKHAVLVWKSPSLTGAVKDTIINLAV